MYRSLALCELFSFMYYIAARSIDNLTCLSPAICMASAWLVHRMASACDAHGRPAIDLYTFQTNHQARARPSLIDRQPTCAASPTLQWDNTISIQATRRSSVIAHSAEGRTQVRSAILEYPCRSHFGGELCHSAKVNVPINPKVALVLTRQALVRLRGCPPWTVRC
jgi:hypothetical protein